ncbi:Crp/Fnr family transcriptional regulator [Nostoc sp. UHCC 0302]|uniref:Crp/Fnr family transcriptional regulator n=1 Tax=Nostoc sp. UHCC 0302 TaxID=3134896 RepID=UPI00311C8B3A
MSAENCLLAALSHELYQTLTPHLKQVSLKQGEILHEPGDTIKDIYFPIDCIISITITMNDGSTTETAMIGKREVAGINAFFGVSETTQTEYIVQVAGKAIKANAQALRGEFERNKQLRDLILRYTQVLIAQTSQTAGCNRLHALEQRLARWLLEVQDRVDSDELKLTQEFTADMLGVRRAGVTQAAQKLQEEGIIRYSRGLVQILDQQRLEKTSCECFRIVKNEHKRLLGRKQK